MVTVACPPTSNYMLRLTDGIDELGAVRWPLVLCLLVAWTIVFLAMLKGVKSFGKVRGAARSMAARFEH